MLSYAQIELLRRLTLPEHDGERLVGALFTTINGIAAGLQTSG